MSPANISTEVENIDNNELKKKDEKLNKHEKAQDDKENAAITKTTIVIPPDGGWGWIVMV